MTVAKNKEEQLLDEAMALCIKLLALHRTSPSDKVYDLYIKSWERAQRRMDKLDGHSE